MPQSPVKRATASDVAQLAGVSRATVGYVLNRTPGQTISDETSRRVRAAAEELNYRPHRYAQVLASGSSDIVLVVLPTWISAHAFGDAVESGARELAEHGLSLITQVRQSDEVSPIWQSVEPLVFATFNPLTSDQIDAMHAVGIKHVLPLSANLPGAMDGVRMQFEHLFSLGHQVLGFAATTDPRGREISVARTTFFSELAQAHGAQSFVEEVTLGDDSADHAVDRWLARGVSAVAAFNDETAAAVVRAVSRRGLSVPEDLSVIGHDDSPLAGLMIPSLSTISVDAVLFGKRLADLILMNVNHSTIGKSSASLFSLTVRESTRHA